MRLVPFPCDADQTWRVEVYEHTPVALPSTQYTPDSNKVLNVQGYNKLNDI